MVLRSIPVLILLLILPVQSLAQEDSEYRIGPEDVLDIQVWSRPDLSGEFAVDTAGRVRLPLIGEVEAAGKSPSELSDELSERYRILDPEVSDVLVSVSEFWSRVVNVVGEVKSPGRYTFRDIPGLWEVLLTAGGPTLTSDLSSVQIVRKNPQAGEAGTVTVDLSAGVEDTDPEKVPRVRPRDTIIVPSLEGQAGSGDSFQVLGAVRRPGVYRIGVAGTVIEALAASGGYTENADLKKIRLARPTQEGIVSYELNLKGHLYDGKPAADFGLKPGDTVTVPGKSLIGPTSILNVVVGLTSIVTAVSTFIIATR